MRTQNVCFPNADNFILMINFRSILPLSENVDSQLLVGLVIALLAFKSISGASTAKVVSTDYCRVVLFQQLLTFCAFTQPVLKAKILDGCRIAQVNSSRYAVGNCICTRFF